MKSSCSPCLELSALLDLSPIWQSEQTAQKSLQLSKIFEGSSMVVSSCFILPCICVQNNSTGIWRFFMVVIVLPNVLPHHQTYPGSVWVSAGNPQVINSLLCVYAHHRAFPTLISGLLKPRDFVQNCEDVEVRRNGLLKDTCHWNPCPKSQLEHGQHRPQECAKMFLESMRAPNTFRKNAKSQKRTFTLANMLTSSNIDLSNHQTFWCERIKGCNALHKWKRWNSCQRYQFRWDEFLQF